MTEQLRGESSTTRPPPVRVGVFLCPCAGQLSDRVDLEAVSAAVATRAEDMAIEIQDLLCTPQGMARAASTMKEQGFEAVVFGACSPREHLPRFEEAARAAGLPRHLVQVANLREQCAWVTPDADEAAHKAAALVRAAIRRVRRQVPLPDHTVLAAPSALVVGGGLAGLTAALTLAEAGRRVLLAEAAHTLGGRVARLEVLVPHGGCGSCLIAPLINDVLTHERITVHTGVRIVRLAGPAGRLRADGARVQRGVDTGRCIGCGACVEACPESRSVTVAGHVVPLRAMDFPHPGALPNAPAIDPRACRRSAGTPCERCGRACPVDAVTYPGPDEPVTWEVGGVVVATGLGEPVSQENPPGVVSPEEVEDLLDTAGPTDGRFEGPGGAAPGRVAFLAGSPPTDPAAALLSRSVILKQAALVAGQHPGARVEVWGLDQHLPGPPVEQLVASPPGAITLRRLEPDREEPRLHPLPSRKGVRLHWPGANEEPPYDQVVTAPQWRAPPGTGALVSPLGVRPGPHGFLGGGAVLTPADTTHGGVWVAGAAGGPCFSAHAALGGQAAAGRLLATVHPGEPIRLPPETARIDATRCSGCGLCVPACGAAAVRESTDEGTFRVDDTLCTGCGACEGACPAGAVECAHATDDQVRGEIRGLLEISPRQGSAP